MKELDDFTVERLTELSTRENLPEVAALARIALAAKTAEPVAWWTGPEPTLTGEIESIHDHETGGHYLPLISISTTSEAALSRERFIFKVANFLCARRQSIAREVETASMIYDMVNTQVTERQKTSIRDGISELRSHIESIGGYNYDAVSAERSTPTASSPELPDGWTGSHKADAALVMLDRIETTGFVDDDRIDEVKRIIRQLAVTQQPQSEPQNIPDNIPTGCKWTYDEYDYKWDSACGESWQFTDGGPEDNHVRFCQGCGKSVLLPPTTEK